MTAPPSMPGPQAAAGPTPGGANPAEAKPAPKEEETPLPEQVAEWKEEHYLQARRKGDARLAEAVKQLGQQATGGDAAQADKTAALLTKLLNPDDFQPPPPPKPAPGTATPGGMMPGYGPGMSSPPGMYSAPPESSSTPGMSAPDSSSSSTSETTESHSATEVQQQSSAEMAPSYSPPAETSSSPDSSSMYQQPGAAYGPMGPGMGPMGPMGPMGQAQGPVYRPLDPATIKTIVECLAAIGNESARQTLGQILAGKLKTDNDRAATEGVLESMVANLRPEYEEVLFAVLTTPEKVRPPDKPGPGQPGSTTPQPGMYSADPSAMYSGMYSPMPGAAGAKMTAADMQKKALALIEPIASDKLRVRLANFLIGPEVPDAQRNLLGRFLTEERPENAAAQLIFHAQEQTAAHVKAAFEGYFSKFSSTAMAGILGIPPDQLDIKPAGQQPSGQPYGDPAMGMSQPPMGMGQPMGPGGPPGATAARGGWTFGFGTARGAGGGQPDMYSGMYPGMDTSMSSHMPGTSMPPGASAAAALPKERAPDPDLPYRLAKLFWAKNFVSPIQNRLEESESLDKDVGQVLLASTMPLGSMRATLLSTLQKHWDSGPNALLAPGVLDQVVSEPGFAIVVKMLDRADPKLGRAMPLRGGMGAMPGGMPMGSSGEGSQPQPGARPGLGDRRAILAEKAAATLRAKMEAEQLSYAWMQTSEQVARALCRRLYTASRAKARAASRAGEELDMAAGRGEKFSEMLPSALEPAAEYHLEWPAQLQQKLQGIALDPIKLHYARYQAKSKPSQVLTGFKRKMRKATEHVSEVGRWMESFYDDPETGNKVSIDVLVTRQKDMAALAGRDASGRAAGGYGPSSPDSGTPYGMPGPGMPYGGTSGMGPGAAPKNPLVLDEPVDLVVEILWIEMSPPDADQGAQKKTPSKKKPIATEEEQ